MELKAQRRSSHARWLAPLAFVLAAGGWGAGAARADIYVHVMNCADVSFEAEAYDAKDGARVFPADTKQFSGQTAQTQQLHCAGEGKGYCQMILTVGQTEPEGKGGTIGFHLDSGKWAVVTGYNYENQAFTVEQNLDAAPSSCD